MKNLIEKFYTAFKNLDAETMATCYHKEIVFRDPAFGTLKGINAKNMWRMLCENQKEKNFKVTFSNIACADEKVTTHWEAYYIFSKTGRRVHNVIDAEFEFKDGLIIKHTDNFNLYLWSKQAFGLTGFFIGWTHFFKKKLQIQTNAMLTKYEQTLVLNTL